MPFDQLGLSFLPSGDANGQRSDAGPSAGGRLEDVLRILSLRLPKVLGAHAIAPGELLNSPGGAPIPSGGGHGGDPIADTIAKHILDGIPPPGAGNPAGSFTPGIPGGTAGPGPGVPPPPPPATYKPRIIPQDPAFDDHDVAGQLRRRPPYKENPNVVDRQNY
jgi:hypothetical protein